MATALDNRIKGIQAPEGRKKIPMAQMRRGFAAPDGAFSVSVPNPRLTPWAIIFRLSEPGEWFTTL
jgi:hypothetical protein